MAAIAGLVEEVARLALHFKLTVGIDGAVEAERAAEALRAATARATEGVVPQSRREAESGDEAQASPMAEVPSTEMSLQPNGGIDDMGKVLDDLCAARSALSQVSAAFAKPQDASRRAENAIAACVLELHDRLGGFIKPHRLPLSQPPEQNT
jgi:hypothetical protein